MGRRDIPLEEGPLIAIREVGGGAGGVVNAKPERPIGIEVFAQNMAQIFTFLILFSLGDDKGCGDQPGTYRSGDRLRERDEGQTNSFK
jgi:hypothetical protein